MENFSQKDIELLYLYLNIEHSIDSDFKKQFNELIEDLVYYHSTIEEAEETVDKALKQIVIEEDRDIVIDNKLNQLIESNRYSEEIIYFLLMLTMMPAMMTGSINYSKAQQRFIHKVAIKSDIDMNMVAEKEDSMQTLIVLLNLRKWLESEGKDIPFQDSYLNEEQASFHIVIDDLMGNMED